MDKSIACLAKVCSDEFYGSGTYDMSIAENGIDFDEMEEQDFELQSSKEHSD